MIQFTRALARQFKGVLRKSLPAGVARGSRLPVIFQASKDGLRVRSPSLEVAVEYHLPGQRPGESIILPGDALDDFEGKSESPVILENNGWDTVQARWDDGAVPQVREYQTIDPEKVSRFPDAPEKFISLDASFLKALDDAGQTTARESTRYALTRLLLRGGSGEMLATDGHQLLIQGGFSFPWKEDLLVPGLAVFGARELKGDLPVSLGKSEKHVCVRVGPWSFHLAIDKDSRFPRAESVIPSSSSGGTVCRLSPEDAVFLAQTLPHLPGKVDDHEPVTLDLNGHFTVRAKGEGQEKVTEVVLSRSQVSGPPVRLVSNRSYLGRMLSLGFTELVIASPSKPAVCRQKDRTYVWMALGDGDALQPSEDAVRITSQGGMPSSTIPKKERRKVAMPQPQANGSARVQVTAQNLAQKTTEPSTNGNGTINLIEEAEGFKESLRDAYNRAARLVAALKQQRKQNRLVQTTLATLKQLQQIEG